MCLHRKHDNAHDSTYGAGLCIDCNHFGVAAPDDGGSGLFITLGRHRSHQSP